MLYADKRALETNLKVNLLAIREKELNYYAQNCAAVGTQAALLAGFAYSGLTQVAVPLDSQYILKLSYLLVTATAMCLELIAVMNTTLLSMMGPGLALRGPDGSMHPAVDGMMEEYRAAYLNFLLGLIFFHFSAALFGWLAFDWVVSSFTTAFVLGSLYLLLRFAMRVHTRFRLPEDEVITGRFRGDEVLANMTGAAVHGTDAKRESRDLSAIISNEQVALAQMSE
jgi:hypothetical protein